MNYRFRAAKSFRRALAKLSSQQKRSAAAAFIVFKRNPFDPRLRPHKIHKLSAAYGKTVHAVQIEGDLRAVFYIEGDTVWKRRYRNACHLSRMIVESIAQIGGAGMLFGQ